jgi:hypothetical protein
MRGSSDLSGLRRTVGAVDCQVVLHGEVRVEGIILEAELMALAGCSQRAALRRHLRRAGIPFKELNGHIITTHSALNAAMVGRDKATRKGPNLDALAAARTL